MKFVRNVSLWHVQDASQNVLWNLHPETMGLWYESLYYSSMVQRNKCLFKMHMKIESRCVQCAFWAHIQHEFQNMHYSIL